jgi:hypothetical protein
VRQLRNPWERAVEHRDRLAAGAVATYTVDGDTVIHDQGACSAVIATSNLDIESLDVSRRAAVQAGFARLCQTLDGPLQVVVRVRRWSAASTERSVSHVALDEAVRGFWARSLAETPVFASTIFLATRGAAKRDLDVAVTRLLDAVHGMGVTAERLRDAELASAAAGGLALDATARWTEHPQYLRLGSTLLRGFVLSRLPGHAVSPGWLAPLLTVPVECDIAIHLRPASIGDAMHTLGRRLRDFTAHRLLEAERGGIGDIHVDVALDSAHGLRHRLARNLSRPLQMSLTVVVRASTLEEMHHESHTARLALTAIQIGCQPSHFRHRAASITTLPLGVDALRTSKLVESVAASTCVPWVQAACDDAGGYRLGAALGSGAPVRIAPFDTSRHTNANVAVFAASGHGKSFAVGTLVLEAAIQDVDAVIIDPEGEYRTLVSGVGGRYLALAPGSDAAVNIFDAGGGDDEEAIAAAVDLIGVLCGERLTDVDRAHVDAAARDALGRASADCRAPLLSDCLPYLEGAAAWVAVVVRRFCTGALGALFNRPTSLQLERGVSALSLREMPAEHVAAITLIIGRWLWRLVRHDSRRRHIVFDEVGALCAHPPLRSLLVQLARRCRKYGASLVVATQNVQDLLGTDDGSVVATNCATVLLGGHRAAETARMERAFGLTLPQRHFLESASRGQFLVLAGDRRLQMRVEVPAEYRALLSGPRG